MRRLVRSFTLLAVLVLGLASPATARARTAPGAAQTGAGTHGPAAQSNLLDINTATRDQLKALPGIGDAYADRMIKGRPYTAKNQLTQRGILPESTYSKIQGMIIARRPAQ